MELKRRFIIFKWISFSSYLDNFIANSEQSFKIRFKLVKSRPNKAQFA